MMTENACKSLRFNTMSVITTILVESVEHLNVAFTTIIPEIPSFMTRGHTDTYQLTVSIEK